MCVKDSLYALKGNGNMITDSELREIVSCCLLGMEYLQGRGLRAVRFFHDSDCLDDQA